MNNTITKEEISNFYTEVSALEAELDAIDEELNPVLDDVRAGEVKDCLIKVMYKDKFKDKYWGNHVLLRKMICWRRFLLLICFIIQRNDLRRNFIMTNN